MTARNAFAVGTFARSYPGDRNQPRLVRAEFAALVRGCPRADDAVQIVSELAANAAVHSNSAASGGRFTVRAEVYYGDYVWIEVEDDGGPWTPRPTGDDHPHGLDLVDALAGAWNWGIDGDSEHGRVAWVRLDWHRE
jgi:serine/threonine-protein kinase RsbW